MAPGSARPLSRAASRPSSALRRSASVLSLPRRTSSSSAWVSSTVAGTPKSASIRTRSIRSRSSALRPRMSAPTSVMATRLMRVQRLSFLSVNLPLAMPQSTLVLAQPQPSSRDPLARRAPRCRARTARANPAPHAARRRSATARRAPSAPPASAAARRSTPRPPPSRRRRPPGGSGTRPAGARPRRGRCRRTAACPPAARPRRSRRCPGLSVGPGAVHSNTTGRPLLTTARTGRAEPSARVRAAQEPARGRGHPGPIGLLAGAAAERPAPEAVHRHDRAPHAPALAARTPPAAGAPRRPSWAVSATQSPGLGLDRRELDGGRKGVHRLAQERARHGRRLAGGEIPVARQRAVESAPAGQVQIPRAVAPSPRRPDRSHLDQQIGAPRRLSHRLAPRRPRDRPSSASARDRCGRTHAREAGPPRAGCDRGIGCPSRPDPRAARPRASAPP